MSGYENKINEGALFPTAKHSVYRQGQINVDGVNKYFAIIESKNEKTGDTYFELYQKVGSIKINQDKESESKPDIYSGIARNESDIAADAYKLSGWKNVSKNGLAWTKVKISPHEENSTPTAEPQNVTNQGLDSPF
ncbi:MAG: hypothetical protein VW683_02730 [Betaproteobacteria bacterium]